MKVVTSNWQPIRISSNIKTTNPQKTQVPFHPYTKINLQIHLKKSFHPKPTCKNTSNSTKKTYQKIIHQPQIPQINFPCWLIDCNSITQAYHFVALENEMPKFSIEWRFQNIEKPNTPNSNIFCSFSHNSHQPNGEWRTYQILYWWEISIFLFPKQCPKLQNFPFSHTFLPSNRQ